MVIFCFSVLSDKYSYLGSGCWLLLLTVDSLPSAALHSLSVLLPQIQQIRLSKAPSLSWFGETLNLSPDITPGVCFATSSFPHGSYLSPDLRRAFVTCSIAEPERRVLMEALLLAHQFQCHRQLSQTLDTLLIATDELFNSHFSIMEEGENRIIRLAKQYTPSVQPTVPLGLRLLEAIVSAGQRYMVDFEKLGLLQGASLQDQSMVLSDISEGGRRASLRLRATNLEQVSTNHVCAVCLL